MKTKMLAAITAALTLASPLARAAAADYLLELDGVKGESRDDVYADSIQVLSWNWSCSNPGSSAGVPTGTVTFTGLEVSTPVSAASPVLMMACATGKPIPKAILHVRKAGTQQEYLTITLTDVMVSSWSTSSNRGTQLLSDAGDDPQPTESLSLNFTKIEYKYIPYDSNSAPVTGTAEIAPRP
jgi:type VI secretion system secreted protein Hcp